MGSQPPTPSDVVLELASATTTLRWSIDGSGGVDSYRIYRAVDVGDFLLVADTSDTEYVDSDVARSALYTYEIAAVLNDVEGNRSQAISGSPGVYGITLEGGVAKTSGSSIIPGSGNINVDLVAPVGTVAFRLSEDADLVNGTTRLLGTGATLFSLSAGDGVKTVYARFFAAGGVQSELVSDEIILDTRAVILDVTEDSGGSTLGAGSVVHFTLVADARGGAATVDLVAGETVVVDNIPLFDDGAFGDVVAGDGVFERDWTVPAGIALANGLVRGALLDDVGNTALETAATTRLTIASAP
ncbi:MAG: fibronectin type III domain-containing protein [Gemmatimonadetes bacterium]|nr:fibronectin type III domain-containing protein [Gemmatimonadota bacterium]